MSLKVIKAGLLDTIQDTGRWGYQHLGVNVNGAMDRFSAQLANALLGKTLNEPVIEMHFPAATIQFQEATVICLTGADFTPTINGKPIPLNQPVAVSKEAVLAFKALQAGARCYLATLQSLQLTPWLGSYSTAYKVGAGGYEGRPLQKEDVLAFTNAINIEPLLQGQVMMPLHWAAEGVHTRFEEVQFTIGNEWYELNTTMQTQFLNQVYTIAPASDRMGYRLVGAALHTEQSISLISSAVSFGTIQLLPNGQLVVLMADHQTTGGYPRIGHVITAHLPHLAQAKPNDSFRFALTNNHVAEEKLLAQHKYLVQLQNACKFKIENRLHAAR
ncbi:biotin-dependent carboxyltransferase family protein [Flavisolibacter tropicus]|uniref:5-oxoprolinase subunit C family protein n=1 Tax=Flavisolibacter tropicus TaxID=1492898 RepID=UPI000829CCDF|nr:biotin-dependent carboxyltransferase family protein [Flavisolibacter tropicus]